MVYKLTVIKERFKQVADNKGISYRKLFKIINMSDGGFKGEHIKRPINSDAIVDLYTEFPDIDLTWLITGKEKKVEIKEENKINEMKKTLNNHYRDLYIEVLEENRNINKQLVAELKKTKI